MSRLIWRNTWQNSWHNGSKIGLHGLCSLIWIHTVRINLQIKPDIRSTRFDPLPDDKILDCSKFKKKKCRRHFKVHLKWKMSAISGRKHCEKRRNFLLQAFFPFLTKFSTELSISLVHQNTALSGNGFSYELNSRFQLYTVNSFPNNKL